MSKYRKLKTLMWLCQTDQSVAEEKKKAIAGTWVFYPDCTFRKWQTAKEDSRGRAASTVPTAGSSRSTDLVADLQGPGSHKRHHVIARPAMLQKERDGELEHQSESFRDSFVWNLRSQLPRGPGRNVACSK